MIADRGQTIMAKFSKDASNQGFEASFCPVDSAHIRTSDDVYACAGKARNDGSYVETCSNCS